MHGHVRADGVGLTLLVDREGWAQLSLIELADGRLSGLDARINRGTASLLRARIRSAAAILAEAYATAMQLAASAQPIDVPLTVCLYIGSSLVEGHGLWLTMDAFGAGRERAWLNLGTHRAAGTWGETAVIAALGPVGEVALAKVAELLMADRSASGPGLGALPKA
jgi:hypothetical protein